LRDYPALTLTWTRPVDAERADLLLADLDGCGVTAVEELPDHAIRAFFTTAEARTRAADHLRSHADLAISASEISDEDWGARSQAAIGAVTVGALTIAPPWAAPSGARGDGLIIIQPSMGFGTGHHASTRLCLEHLQSVPLKGARVLDVGTGSGVLAIAAARLGAAEVVGIDLDADALSNASENAGLNGVSERIDLRELTLVDARSLGRTFDVIVANLTGGHLRREASHLAPLAAPNAHLIVSGFQADESIDVIHALESAGWTLSASAAEATWVAALFTRL
jgi:ribosomal protein L11 methyltransferase